MSRSNRTTLMVLDGWLFGIFGSPPAGLSRRSRKSGCACGKVP
ncbi:MAG: hypothetical protein ACRDZV_12520 [Acidimicrobiia bacterium]